MTAFNTFQLKFKGLTRGGSQTVAPPTGLHRPETESIVVKGLEMTIKSGRETARILKGIDWSIQKGSVQLLMGPSGSGKTTLLSVLAGLLTPTSGNVYLLGQDITKMSRSQLAQFRLQNIGFIFQDFNLFPALTAAENIEVALNLKGIKGKAAKQEAQRLLEQVGLKDKANLKPSSLSGGQQQRVAIARALAGNPQLIMADEPTAALDSQNGHAVMALLRELAKERGCTVLMVTHDPRIIDLADNIAYMEDGILKNG
ncbi:ABC transporter ATP-binding protein [Microseira sp. BLCC-F43]|jgi:putative ABC transport system ATP-binding protein|uniref:ABC transporter ATP-binding protein n=1 Tax=Microseira sp. BLCC-F43 TaxID=3153602 RepID=UPI0035B73D90